MSPLNRFVILREAGGIGDVVRTFPVARGLKEMHPGARVDYCCLAGYEGLVRLSPDVDRVFTVTERERRPRDATPDPARFPYLRRVLGTTSPQRSQSTQRTTTEGPGERLSKTSLSAVPSSSVISVSSVVNDVAVDVIDLYCPAYRHERETGGAVTLDRVEIFARAAGVEASTPRIVVPEGVRRLARTKLRRFLGGAHGFATEVTEDTENGKGFCRRGLQDIACPVPSSGSHLQPAHTQTSPSSSVTSVSSVAGRVVVGLAPYATHVSRSLPDAHQVTELAALLREAGARLVFFHSWKCARPGRDEVRPADIGAYPALRLPWPELAATIASCNLVISVDTGIFHLAGALGVPTLGLFGPTSGEVMCRPYPTHSPVTSPGLPPGCDPPCYGRPARGYSRDVCGRVGCEVLRSVTPDAVLRRVRERCAGD